MGLSAAGGAPVDGYITTTFPVKMSQIEIIIAIK
jgi:hypothetical protein